LFGCGVVVAEVIDAEPGRRERERIERVRLDLGEIVKRDEADGDVREVVERPLPNDTSTT